jgi:hypothetical protein
MRFKKILRSPMLTNQSLNARSPLGNDERSFAVRGRSSDVVGSGNRFVAENFRYSVRL